MTQVDVVIPFSPAHTPDSLLDRAVESVEAQTVSVRPIVVEDEQQRGPAWARNVGLNRAEEQFVAFCDADDYWKEAKLERQLEALSADESSLCLTQTVHSDSDEMNVVPFDSATEFAEDVLFGRTLSFTSSMVIDTTKVQPQFDEELSRREDHLFALQAASKGVSFVPAPLTVIDKHPDGLSARDERVANRLATEQRFVAQAVEAFPHLKAHEPSYWHEEYHRAGRIYYFESEYDRSIDCLKTALSHRFHHRTLGALVLSYLARLFD